MSSYQRNPNVLHNARHALQVTSAVGAGRRQGAIPLASLQAMAAADDDATLTQLATAWAGLALGGAKVQEAAYVYQELGDKYTWTVRVGGLDGGMRSCCARRLCARATVKRIAACFLCE